MNLEECSIDFLQWHMGRNGFREIIEQFLVSNFTWMDETFEREPSVRPYAKLSDDDGLETDLILLFPPFHTAKPKKYYEEKEWTTYWK